MAQSRRKRKPVKAGKTPKTGPAKNTKSSRKQAKVGGDNRRRSVKRSPQAPAHDRQDVAAVRRPIKSKGTNSKASPPQTDPVATQIDRHPAGARAGSDPSFPVAGIGASAGGLEAITQLLSALPHDAGLSYVVVQHLAPQHESILAELLSRATRMRVAEVRDGMPVEPDHVYVIPPNTNMALMHGRLSLMPRSEEQGQPMPIDYFFRSLAEDQGGQAIGVILSGTASDGTQGLAAIKAEGGVTFAQEPASAKYDGMPRSAIAAGVVDFALQPAEIARELVTIGRHPYVAPLVRKSEEVLLPGGEETLNKIFIMLRSAFGVDFALYKHTTVKRRVMRRMVVHRIESLAEYLRYLQKNKEELSHLYDDILINVTSFFREPEAFEVLKDKVYPAIVKSHPADVPLRMWVPGCSTGEEAYSLAISVVEFSKDSDLRIQIFATDVSDKSIDKARQGVYPEGISADVSPVRLKRFFRKVEGGYQVNKSIRDICTFAKQNVAKDAPFSKIDLISCRNLLIYMSPALQKKIIPIFHYALNPWGFLLLGRSETVGTFADLFSLTDRRSKIYSKKANFTRLPMDFAVSDYQPGAVGSRTSPASPVPETGKQLKSFDLQQEADRAILKKYAPPGVTVDSDLEILQFRGHTGPYLEPMPGAASLNLLKMVREDILLDVRTAVHDARKSGGAVRKDNLRVRRNGRIRAFNLEVVPIAAPNKERFFLILFEETRSGDGTAEAEKPKAQAEAKGKTGRKGLQENAVQKEIARLRTELESTQSYLQYTIEQNEATNEELRSANEEIQSSNEELQSTNEELETAKEELQSANEELTTVNEELENRNAELNQLNNDLNNLLTGGNNPILMVGPDLRINRFTEPAARIFHLTAGDVGKEIDNIRIPGLTDLALQVIGTLGVIEQDVRSEDGHWYSIRIRPYLTTDNRIDGAVVSLFNIDSLKSLQQQIVELQLLVDWLLDAVPPLLVVDDGLKVKMANRPFCKAFEVDPEQTTGRPVYDLGDGLLDIPEFRAWLTIFLADMKRTSDLRLTHEFKRVGEKRLIVSGSRVGSADGEPGKVLFISFRDSGS